MTEIISRPRGAGKTYETLQRMAVDTRIVYIAVTQRHAQMAFEMARGLGFDIARERFTTFHSVLRDQAGRDTETQAARHYVVDNADLILSQALGGTLDAITVTSQINNDPYFVKELDDALAEVKDYYTRSDGSWPDDLMEEERAVKRLHDAARRLRRKGGE